MDLQNLLDERVSHVRHYLHKQIGAPANPQLISAPEIALNGLHSDIRSAIQTEASYYEAVHKHFVEYLASQYRNGMAVEIAGLCDETLDRSGRLLGEVRQAARK